MELDRQRLRISGTVQGVGYRPFVHGLAHRIGLTGVIGNDEAGVWCEIQGPTSLIDDFRVALSREAPPLARVESIVGESLEPVRDERDFRIASSLIGGGSASASVPADAGPCRRCADEIADPSDRRHRYAFTCCTDCGPRYTVVKSLPYDRSRTSMDDFALCTACLVEYASPGDRRHHAQATCCPDCGPTLTLTTSAGDPVDGDPMEGAAAVLVRGRTLALKGVGGYQLVCRADDSAAVRRLRDAKHRDQKPFAVLTRDVASANLIVRLEDISLRALSGPEAPIVLAPRRTDAPIAVEVAPDSELLGVMLPSSPLHELLVAAVGVDLVCTSGNRSNEPIVTDDIDAVDRLGGFVDAVLSHDRRIVRHADDSVGQVVHGRFQLSRRARGFAPRPVRLHVPGPAVLGVGAELKNTVCLASGSDAHVSAHLGDLEHARTLVAFERAIADLVTMVRAEPELVVHDMHPEYLSTKFATTQDLAPTLAVQHHHAHLASCLADNGHDGVAIGVTFDGLGWGPDATMWGGEFLVGDAHGYERAAHLRTVALPGGAAAVREPWRMAAAHLFAVYGDALPDLAVIDRHVDDVDGVVRLCSNEQVLTTTSIGRLFDAIAAMCGITDRVSYEGQAAILLEQAVTETPDRYEWLIENGDALIADPTPLIEAIVSDLRGGIAAGVIAGALHCAVADLVVDIALRLRDRDGTNTVALTGGVFQNRLLVEMLMPLLDRHDFETLRHGQVPPNDGGISLGQVAIGRASLVESPRHER